jgi:hypothetical protein
MANYTLANLVKAQIKLQGEFASNDQRYRIPEVFRLFLNGAEQFFPNYKQLKTSDTRVVETNYFKRTAQTLITTGRAHNHTGSGGDSGTLTLTWQTYSTTFSMTLKQADTSIYSWQEEFTNEIRNKVIDFANGLDAVAGAYLFSNRSGASSGTVTGKVTYDATDDVYVIAGGFKDEVATLIKLVADINKYQGQQIDVVCDSILYSNILKLANQGAGNATNTSFQFAGTRFIHDPLMGARFSALDVTYVEGCAIAVPMGHIACADWIPVQNRNGVETTVNMYGSLLNPVDGLQYAVHSYEDRADGTSVNGQKQDVLTETEVSIDLSFNHAPSSVANETPLMAFAIVTA